MNKNGFFGASYFAWERVALIAVFLLAGIIGHEPWKQDETYTFGIIYHFYTTHSWLIPMSGDAPFMEKPPLYYWTAVVFCRLFGGLLPLPDAARLTSVFYMALAAFFVWKAALALYAVRKEDDRQNLAWISVVLFLGTLGVARHAHDMFTDVALMAGTAAAVYGMALIACKPGCARAGGFWLGIGAGGAFLSKGFPVPAILGISGIVLLILLPSLRTRRTAHAVAHAFCAAAPFLFIWPILLYLHSPELFHTWFWQNNVGRFLGFSVARLGADNQPGYFLLALLWFAFPAFYFALAQAILRRREWRRAEYLLPVTLSIVGITLLLASASARALYLLPLIIPFALLGADASSRIPPKALGALSMIVRILGILGGAGIVLSWFCLLHPTMLPAFSAILGHHFPAGFMLQHQLCEVALAIAIVLLAKLSFRRDARAPSGAAQIWLAAVALLWGLGMTLLLPWIDAAKSYRPVFEGMFSYLRVTPYAQDCIGNDSLGESLTPLLQYYDPTHAPIVMQGPDGTECRLLLMDEREAAPADFDPRWRLIWHAARPLDSKARELRLYVHK